VGESTPLRYQTNYFPQVLVGRGRGQVGCTYLRPKDSNAAVGVHDCATQEAPEG